MHRLKYDRAVRRWDALTKIGNGGMAMGCPSLGRQWWHGEGMRRPKRANGEAMRQQKMGNGSLARGCASQMEQYQIGGLAANAPANEETESAGNAPAE